VRCRGEELWKEYSGTKQQRWREDGAATLCSTLPTDQSQVQSYDHWLKKQEKCARSVASNLEFFWIHFRYGHTSFEMFMFHCLF